MKIQPIFQILYELQNKTSLKGRWYDKNDGHSIDGVLELDNSKVIYALPAEYKKEIKPFHLIALKDLKETNKNLIVLSEQIFPTIRDRLREMGINYIDSTGNCFIQINDWHFLIDGLRAPSKKSVQKNGFTRTGLILTFHFLNDENYLNTTYRQIAEDYKISLGNVNKIINSLKEQNYIAKGKNKTLRIINRDKLLEQWILEYDEKLKPTLFLGEFRFINEYAKDWTKVPLGVNSQWGGEPAGDLLTNYLQPAELTLYTKENSMDLIKKLKIAPGKGNLKIYSRFWMFNDKRPNVVPTILVYADLVNTGDPRNIETAKMLIDGLFRD